MATVMMMHWPEVTREQYETVREQVNWEGNVPDGAKLHVAYFGDDGFHVMDLWESREQFETFAATRLRAGVEKAGIQGQPSVTFAESHAVFAPNP